MPVIARDTAFLSTLTPQQLYGELALAAHRLANTRLTEAHSGWPAICHECGMKLAGSLLDIPHAEHCMTGATVRVLLALSRAEMEQNFDRHIAEVTPPTRTEGKEIAAQQDAGEAAAREMRPHARPFLVSEAGELGRYAEPWRVDGTGAVYDALNNTIAEPVGCELVEPDDRRAMERIAACVNYCDGIPTAELRRIGGVM
jgi:hypothetical protein